MSPRDGRGRLGGESIKVWREAARMAASLTLLAWARVFPFNSNSVSNIVLLASAARWSFIKLASVNLKPSDNRTKEGYERTARVSILGMCQT